MQGARVHNLKNISVELPRDALIVVTGLSGSGKSSLAFDTIYAEGQRRYMESLSSYAKRFVAQVAKPDVDFVFGLSPVISIEQKTTGNNPRSTVGTMTDVASYLNLLFATIGQAHCPRTGEPTPSRTASQILEAILSLPEGTEVELRAPVFPIYGEDVDVLYAELRKKGVRRVIVDGEIVDLADRGEPEASEDAGAESEAGDDESTSAAQMDAIVDRFIVGRKHEKAIKAGIAATLLIGDGLMQIQVLKGRQGLKPRRPIAFYKDTCSATHHLVYGDIGPAYFQFNNPESACRTCGGLGVDKLTHPELLVPDPDRSILGGCFVREAFKYNPDTWDGRLMFSLSQLLNFPLDSPWKTAAGIDSRRHPLRHGHHEDQDDVATGCEGASQRSGWARGRLPWDCPADRAVLPAVPPARRGELARRGVARQGHGRARVPGVPGRARARHEAAVQDQRPQPLRAGPAALRRAAALSFHREDDRAWRRCRTTGAQ